MATTTTTPSKPSSGSMTPVRITDPWSAMRQDMSDLITNFWGGPDRLLSNSSFAPEMDISEAENNFEVRMDIPGMEAKDLDIQVHGNTITVSGQKKEEKEEKGKTYHRIERRSGSFSRTVTLPCHVTEKEVAAEYTNGVLTLILPKCEESRPKKIAVRG